MERLAQCHCGSLRATTFGEPLLVAICHCKACQRRTGALAASVAGFAQARVAIEGETKVFDRDGQSGRKVRFYFCPNCGTSLYWEADARPDLFSLRSEHSQIRTSRRYRCPSSRNRSTRGPSFRME